MGRLVGAAHGPGVLRELVHQARPRAACLADRHGVDSRAAPNCWRSRVRDGAAASAGIPPASAAGHFVVDPVRRHGGRRPRGRPVARTTAAPPAARAAAPRGAAPGVRPRTRGSCPTILARGAAGRARPRPCRSGIRRPTPPFTNRMSLRLAPPWFVGSGWPRRRQVGPADGADLASPHPGHERGAPVDHGVEAAAIEGDLLGFDADGWWRGRRPSPPRSPRRSRPGARLRSRTGHAVRPVLNRFPPWSRTPQAEEDSHDEDQIDGYRGPMPSSHCAVRRAPPRLHGGAPRARPAPHTSSKSAAATTPRSISAATSSRSPSTATVDVRATNWVSDRWGVAARALVGLGG